MNIRKLVFLALKIKIYSDENPSYSCSSMMCFKLIF